MVALGKLGVSGLVLAEGFRALSDDDFARVTISQRFAVTPAWDPTGSSWLPLPFWLQGATMALLGRSLEVARITSLVAGVASALLVLVAARWLGVPRWGALLGAVLACAIPYAAWLGVATVPDGPTAALILLGAVAAGCTDVTRRSVGAVALLAATLCRYEAWPVAVLFTGVTALDAWRQRSSKLALAALVPTLGPVGWMVHGASNHGSAWFFVTRVTAYREALGGEPSSALGRAIEPPLALLRCEPELAAVTGLALLCLLSVRQSPSFHSYRRPALLLAGLVAFLVAGQLRGSAPTHHDERPLLAVWLGLAVFVGHALCWCWKSLGSRRRGLLVAAGVGLVGLGALVLRPRYGRLDPFVDRTWEVDIGRRAKTRIAAERERVLIDTTDYGFYAVMAALGCPERATAFEMHDPRKPAPEGSWSSATALQHRLQAEHAAWFIIPTQRETLARSIGRVRARNPRFVLLEYAP